MSHCREEVDHMAKKEGLPNDQAYQLYLDERRLLIDAEREGSRTFDKAILTLASGAFGFSIAFLKDIVPHPYANTLSLLGWSWALFSLSLVTILFSFLSSQFACRFQIELTYEELIANTKRKNVWATITDVCNFASIIVLALAFILWGCFVYWNVIHT
jgi:hypothetical protein